MLGAIAGGESLEILVMLKDLSEKGLKRLESNIKSTETKVNATNFSGFSKASKGLASDAEKAAGAGGKGGLGNLISSFTGIPAPIAIAGAAISGIAALMAGTIPTYERVTRQEKLLDAAFAARGESFDKLRPKIEDQIAAGEKWAFSADDTRGAILMLAQAGHKWNDIVGAMPTIMQLAQAKHLDLAEAAKKVELAEMGNARALRELGITLPKLSTATFDHAKATRAVTDAQTKLKIAEDELNALQGKAVVTTEKYTTATKGHAASAAQLQIAQDRLALAQQRLAALEAAHTVTTQNLNQWTGKITTSTKGHEASANALAAAQLAVLTAENNLNVLEGKHVTTTGHLTTATKGHAASALALEKAQLKVKEASDKLKAATDKLAAGHALAEKAGHRQADVLALIDKKLGPPKDHSTDLDKAQKKLGDTWEKFSVKIGPAVSKAMAGIADALDRIVQGLMKVLDWTVKAINKFTEFLTAAGKVMTASGALGSNQGQSWQGGFLPGTMGFNLGGGKAAGGPVLPGGVYTVGERGPETLVMGNRGIGGMVIPHSPGGGGTTVIHLTHVTNLDGRELARSVDTYLHRSIAMAGTGIRRPMGG